jgi:hypothetical protein
MNENGTNEYRLVTHERETDFQKQSRTCLAMAARLLHLAKLIIQIKDEPAIPDHHRDGAIQSVQHELVADITVFKQFLANFINTAELGLHHLDIEVDAVIVPPSIIDIRSAWIRIDDHPVIIPAEIGYAFIRTILSDSGSQDIPTIILSYYRGSESRFDQMDRGDFNRCSLRLSEEIYPGRHTSVVIRLPAAVLIDERIL